MNAQLANWGSSLLPFGSDLLWTALPWMLLCGVAGLVLAVLICYQLARKCLLVRRPPAWHVATKLSYVLILLALPVLGGAFRRRAQRASPGQPGPGARSAAGVRSPCAGAAHLP